MPVKFARQSLYPWGPLFSGRPKPLKTLKSSTIPRRGHLRVDPKNGETISDGKTKFNCVYRSRGSTDIHNKYNITLRFHVCLRLHLPFTFTITSRYMHYTWTYRALQKNKATDWLAALVANLKFWILRLRDKMRVFVGLVKKCLQYGHSFRLAGVWLMCKNLRFGCAVYRFCSSRAWKQR